MKTPFSTTLRSFLSALTATVLIASIPTAAVFALKPAFSAASFTTTVQPRA